jgi:hypothetical protein
VQIAATSASVGCSARRVAIGPQSFSGAVISVSPAVVSHVQPYAEGVETR